MDDLFSVYQFFPDGFHERVRRGVDAKEAVKAAMHYSHCVTARLGLTQRVIITDAGDCIAWEWRYGEGVVFGQDPDGKEQEDR